MAKKVAVQYDHLKIPIIGLVAENKSSAVVSPVNGQFYYDTTDNRLYVLEDGAWVKASAAGSEQTANKGQANGYASLDASITVPIAQIPTGTTGSTVPFGNDARFSDQRVPTDGSVTGGTAGAGVKIAAGTITAANIAAATITDTQIATANKDGAAGTASLRTLGTGATQAVAGNDARLSDQRTPLDNSVTSAKIVDGTIVHGDINAANIDGLAAVPSLRTLGTGAQQALAGNTRLDQLAVPTAAVSMNGQRLTGLPAPAASDDPARLADLQAATLGIDNKPSTRIVLTANDSLSGLAARDGVTPVANDRVLAVAQTDPTQNGPWLAQAGTWVRATDQVTAGSFWMVTEGSNAGSQWKVATADPITVGTTALTINQFGASGTVYTGTSNRVTVSGGAIDIAATYVGQTSITTLGTIATGTWNATTIALNKGGTGATTAAAARANLAAIGKYAANLTALTAGVEQNVVHSLNTTDLVGVSFKDTATGELIELGARVVDANTIAVIADVAYASGAVRVTVGG